MQNNVSSSFFDFTPDALQLVGEARLAYVRKVYSYFSMGIAGGILGALGSIELGMQYVVAQHPIIGLLVMVGMVIFASKSATHPTRAVPTLMAFTFISGVIISPTLFAIAAGYVPGATIGTIYSALLLTGLVFGGLTAYVFLSKKDFSYMGASLTMGLLLMIGVGIVNIFIRSSAMDMALSIVGVVIFSGFVLVDTSRILRHAHETPATMAALSLYLDFLNLFMLLLRLLSGGGRRD